MLFAIDGFVCYSLSLFDSVLGVQSSLQDLAVFDGTCYTFHLDSKSQRSALNMIFPDLQKMLLIKKPSYSIYYWYFFCLSLSSLGFSIIKKFGRWLKIFAIMFAAIRLLVHLFINILSQLKKVYSSLRFWWVL